MGISREAGAATRSVSNGESVTSRLHKEIGDGEQLRDYGGPSPADGQDTFAGFVGKGGKNFVWRRPRRCLSSVQQQLPSLDSVKLLTVPIALYENCSLSPNVSPNFRIYRISSPNRQNARRLDFSMLSLFKGLQGGRILDFTLQGMPEQKTFRPHKRGSCLQELFADVSKGMQTWKNFVPTAKCFSCLFSLQICYRLIQTEKENGGFLRVSGGRVLWQK